MPDIQTSSIDTANRHSTFASRMWPADATGVAAVLRAVILIVMGTALLTLSAKINVPLPYVPMTLQTLVVPLIGIVYGWRLGLATVLAYLAEGASGLPVFAGPIGGLAYMAGPTGGYLAGFVVAVVLSGWASERGFSRSIWLVGGLLLAAHAVILSTGFGWLTLALGLGAQKAWLVGVVPFLAGSVIKSALGAGLVAGLRSVAKP